MRETRKEVRKDAKIGRIRREEREREQEKALTKKANIQRRAMREGNTKNSREQTEKRSSTMRKRTTKDPKKKRG